MHKGFVPFIDNKQSAAFYRKLILAFLIDSNPNVNLVALEKLTGWPKRTIQDSLREIKTISIVVSYQGSSKNGFYQVDSWGLIDKSEVYERIELITDVFYKHLNK